LILSFLNEHAALGSGGDREPRVVEPMGAIRVGPQAVVLALLSLKVAASESGQG
jgi:hypothetical protein